MGERVEFSFSIKALDEQMATEFDGYRNNNDYKVCEDKLTAFESSRKLTKMTVNLNLSTPYLKKCWSTREFLNHLESYPLSYAILA